MDLRASDHLERYRASFRDLIARKAPPLRAKTGFRAPTSPEGERQLRQWKADLYEAGYLGGDWPEEWGGSRPPDAYEELVIVEELARAGLPPLNDQTTLASQALLLFGDDHQKARHLPHIRRGAQIWCQLFSEPDAGSDLANVQTRAVRDGDQYVVSGQKVWSTNAQWADYGLLLARSELSEIKHRSLSCFIIDMRQPGIDVRPLRELTGTSDFNEVFFDGATVPADGLLGGSGGGWAVAMGALGAERAGIGAGALRLRTLREQLYAAARSDIDGRVPIHDEGVRQELGRIDTLVEISVLLVMARVARERRGISRPSDDPIGKLMFSEVNADLAATSLRLLGERALLTEEAPGALDEGRWVEEYLYAPTYTIAGGSSEIMRNILAERVLGLPRVKVSVSRPTPAP